MEPVVLAVLIGVAVYVAVVAVIPRHILAESSGHTKNILRELERDTSDLAGADESAASVLREHIQQGNVLSRAYFALPGARSYYPRLAKAGLGDSVDSFFIGSLVCFLSAVYITRTTGLWSPIFAALFTCVAAHWFVSRRIKKRTEVFLNLFPDALDIIVRSVRSGYPLNATMRIVADNMQPPVSDEFRRVADEIAYGSTLMDSLTRMASRIDEPDIRFFVVVLAVQQEVGGNLAEVLSNLSGIIRRRKHLRLKIRAMTSEGRATAWVLGLLPVFEFGAIYLVSPGHLMPFFNTTAGNILFAGTICIVLLGAFIVRQIVNMEV